MHVNPWDWMVSAWRNRPAQLPAQPAKSPGILPASIDEYPVYSVARLQPQEQKRPADTETAGAKRDGGLAPAGADPPPPAMAPVEGMNCLSTLQQHAAANGRQRRRGEGDTQADARRQRHSQRAHQDPTED